MSSSSPVLTDSLSFVGSLLPASLAHTIEKDLGPLFQLAPIDHPTRSLNPNVTTVYSSEFGFERLFESREYVDSISHYMKDKWKLSFVFAGVYLLFVVVGRWFMSTRQKFEIRKPLIAWNILLAVFSIIGSIRVWPEFLHAVFDRGIVYSVCDASYAYSITGFWAFLFCMSKLPELVDTVFIVLRKQELIFLHYYHHATVLIYCWFSYKEHAASGRWFMCMNYVVHSLMYSYYALKAMRIRVPLFVSKLITFLQIAQMFFGCYVNWIAYQTKLNSPQTYCHISDDNIFYSFLMYLSYFLLFFQFFLDAYVKSNAKHKLRLQQIENEKKAAANGSQFVKNGTLSNGSTKKSD